MMMSNERFVVSPFSRPATSDTRNHCFSSSQPSGSGVVQPNRSPPEVSGIVNRPMSPSLPGEFVTEPPGSLLNSSLAMKRASPGARMLIAKPLTMWLTPKVTVAMAWSSPPSMPPIRPPTSAIHGPKYQPHQPAKIVPMIIMPSRPMFTVPLRSA